MHGLRRARLVGSVGRSPSVRSVASAVVATGLLLAVAAPAWAARPGSSARSAGLATVPAAPARTTGAAGTSTPLAGRGGPPPSAPPPGTFEGISPGLVVLGLMSAAAVAALLLEADRAVGRLADAAPCAGQNVDLG
jgi:hypothetical protein